MMKIFSLRSMYAGQRDSGQAPEQSAATSFGYAYGTVMTFPLSLKAEGGEWWALPYEPQISVDGSNMIVKKSISKGRVRGTVKERWTCGDYSISISGILIGDDGNYPTADVQRLRSLCEAAKLEVMCPLLEMFSIAQVTVESFSIPFTSGVRNQAYTINAVSDDIYRLLLKREDLKLK